MGEDKSRRFLKRQQPLFVLQDQIVCGDIIGNIRSALDFRIDLSALFIDGKVPVIEEYYNLEFGLAYRGLVYHKIHL